MVQRNMQEKLEKVFICMVVLKNLSNCCKIVAVRTNFLKFHEKENIHLKIQTTNSNLHLTGHETPKHQNSTGKGIIEVIFPAKWHQGIWSKIIDDSHFLTFPAFFKSQ